VLLWCRRSVPVAYGLVGATDLVEDGGDLRMIVGVLVPITVGRGGDGPGLVPVIWATPGPFPAVIFEVKVEPAGAERTDEPCARSAIDLISTTGSFTDTAVFVINRPPRVRLNVDAATGSYGLVDRGLRCCSTQRPVPASPAPTFQRSPHRGHAARRIRRCAGQACARSTGESDLPWVCDHRLRRSTRFVLGVPAFFATGGSRDGHTSTVSMGQFSSTTTPYLVASPST